MYHDKYTERIMPLAKKEGWTVIELRAGWKTVFPER
jgi:hypothetical protein